MGSVYRASQTDPIKREVALKLIKSGMDSHSVLARFDAERQALALMDHPNIARIYDGGVTHDGQPFFVMELVNGVPLTDYCDQKRLTVNDRLELFVSICQAVQHAHQKGIIHRDLKPSNVLVTEVDGRPTPKIIDFGVAKATEQRLTEMTFADTGAIVGTPAYMSPEQADPTSMDIDTRTDVYALGVMLYELLVGSPPLDAKQFQRGAILELLRMVREVDPPRPSTKLSHADALPNIAANRSIEPTQLTKLLHGELDWVVMKALEKDRTRRYDTANGLARDIQRYLADEVVEARPPSRGYRIKKFVKRNKIQVIAASLVFTTLVGGIVGTSLAMLAARQARDAEAEQRQKAEANEQKALAAALAEKAAKLDAEARRQEAQRNLAFAKKGNEILGSVFASLTAKKIAESRRPLQDLLRENLVKAVKELEGSAIGDPLEVAAMQDTLGRSLLALGDSDESVILFKRVHDTWTSLLGPVHPNTLSAMNCLALGYQKAGRLDKALPLFEKTLRLMKANLGPDHPNTIATMSNLAGVYRAIGQLEKALPLMKEALGLMKARLGADHADTLTSMNNLALAYQDTGQRDTALPLMEETLRLTRAKLGPDHPDTLSSMGNLAAAYRDTGQLDKALPLLEETFQRHQSQLGPDHPDTLISMNNLAMAYRDAGKLNKAVPLLEQALNLGKAELGPEHPFTLASMNNLATAYWSAKRLDRSLPLFEQLLPVQARKLGRPHPSTQRTVANLGVNYKDAGRVVEALPLLEEAYQSSQKLPNLRWVATPLLDAYIQAGKHAEATKLIGELVADARKSLPNQSPALADRLDQFGLSLLRVGAFTDAEPLLREALSLREKSQPEMWNTCTARALLGWSLLGQKKYADAEPLLLSGYEGMKQREATIPVDAKIRLPEALDRLIELYTATNKADEVKKWQAERAKYPKADPPAVEKR